MWDMNTGRCRGFGFAAFRECQDAEKALSSMDGEWLGSRAIMRDWPNQKGQPSISQQHEGPGLRGACNVKTEPEAVTGNDEFYME